MHYRQLVPLPTHSTTPPCLRSYECTWLHLHTWHSFVFCLLGFHTSSTSISSQISWVHYTPWQRQGWAYNPVIFDSLSIAFPFLSVKLSLPPLLCLLYLCYWVVSTECGFSVGSLYEGVFAVRGHCLRDPLWTRLVPHYRPSPILCAAVFCSAAIRYQWVGGGSGRPDSVCDLEPGFISVPLGPCRSSVIFHVVHWTHYPVASNVADVALAADCLDKMVKNIRKVPAQRALGFVKRISMVLMQLQSGAVLSLMAVLKKFVQVIVWSCEDMLLFFGCGRHGC